MTVDGHVPAVFGPWEGPASSRPAKLVESVGRVMARRETIVALPEQIDIRNAAGVAEELTLAVSHSSVVIIDMTATRFCDCAGARAIVRAHKRASDSGAELRLVVSATLVLRILGLVGVDRLLDIYPSVQAAQSVTPIRNIF